MARVAAQEARPVDKSLALRSRPTNTPTRVRSSSSFGALTVVDILAGIDQATDQAGLGDKYDDKINKFAVR